MSYLYTVGLKVIVEEVLTALTETPTVYAYDFLTGDALTSPAPTITSVRTGVYRLSVTANVLTDVLFVFIPHQDDEDKIGQEALMHEKIYHVVDELANGVTLVDGAITADKIADNAISRYKVAINTYEDTAFYVQKRMGDKFEVFITGKYPDIVVSDAGSAGVNGVYEYQGILYGKPVYAKVGGVEFDQIRWNGSQWKLDYDDDGYYYSTDDVPTPDLVTTWQVEYGSAPVPTVTPNDTSLYAQLEAMRGAGWTDESLVALMTAIEAIEGGGGGDGLDAAGVRAAVGLASANLDTQLSAIKTDTGNVANRLTATRAGYIDKLNISGTLANTDNAGDFKADVSGLAKTTDLSGLAEKTDIPSDYAKANALTTVDGKADAIKAQTDKIPATPAPANEYDARLTTIQADLDNPDQYKANVSGLMTSAQYTAPDNAGITAIKAKTDNLPASPAATDEYTSALTTIQADLDNPSQYKADVSTLESRLSALRAGYLDKLNVVGALANTDNAGSFKADVTGLAKTTDLSGLAEKTDIPNDYAKANALTTVDGKVDAVKAQTDKIPATPAPANEYDARLTTIQADLDNPDQYKADVSALATSAEVGALNNITAAEVLAEEVIGGYSLAQVLTALAAKMHGLASGAGTTTITYEGIDGTSNVVVETVDGKGNRSNVVLNI